MRKPETYIKNSTARSDFLDFDCLAYATRRSARAVTNLLIASFCRSSSMCRSSACLRRSPRCPAPRLKAIGEAMLLDESTLARNFSVLERRGWSRLKAEGAGRQASGRSPGQEQSSMTTGAIIWVDTSKRLAAELGPCGKPLRAASSLPDLVRRRSGSRRRTRRPRRGQPPAGRRPPSRRGLFSEMSHDDRASPARADTGLCTTQETLGGLP